MSLGDALLGEAKWITVVTRPGELIRETLRALVERESARRLARLGGIEPRLAPVRWRSEAR